MPRGTNPYDEARHQGRLWTPARLGGQGLRAWYDAGDLNTLTFSSGNVATWLDKSGNGYTLTPGSGATVTYSTNPVRQGSTGVTFDGQPGVTGPWLENTSWSFANGTKFHVFIRLYFWFAPNNPRYVSMDTGASNDFTSGGGYAPVLVEGVLGSYNPGVGVTASRAISNFTDILMSHVSTASSIDNYYNGGAVVTNANAVTAFTPGRLTVGALSNGAGTAPMAGGIKEIVILTGTAPGIDVIRKIEGYLDWNCRRTNAWGQSFSNNTQQGVPLLAADHPYRNRPPLIGD